MTEEKVLRHGTALHRRKRRRTVALGAGILLFAATGICVVLILIIRSAASYVKDFVGPDENAAYFEAYLAPVVMFDPAPFSDLSKSTPQWKLQTAIWAALGENEQKGAYALTADGREILPINDIGTYYKKYFNVSEPAYMTFSQGDFTYEYDKKNRCYYIPLIAVTDYYIPRVSKISKNFKTVTLTVEYVSGKDWGQGEDDASSMAQASAEKTMKIVLTSGRNGFILRSVEQAQTAGALASAAA